jgi:hypothetical protein
VWAQQKDDSMADRLHFCGHARQRDYAYLSRKRFLNVRVDASSEAQTSAKPPIKLTAGLFNLFFTFACNNNNEMAALADYSECSPDPPKPPAPAALPTAGPWNE